MESEAGAAAFTLPPRLAPPLAPRIGRRRLRRRRSLRLPSRVTSETTGSVCGRWPQTLPGFGYLNALPQRRDCSLGRYAALLFAFGGTGAVGMLIVRVISSSDIL